MSKSSEFLSGVKGVVVALIFSMICVLLFALAIDLFSLPLSVIKPVNLILKILAVVIGTLFAVKDNKGLFKGIIMGLAISFSAFLLFGTIGGEIEFSLPFLWELLLGMVVGAISGIASVALKK